MTIQYLMQNQLLISSRSSVTETGYYFVSWTISCSSF